MKIYGKILSALGNIKTYKLGVGVTEDGQLLTSNYYTAVNSGGRVPYVNIAGCSGKATQLLNPNPVFGEYGYVNDVMSWGYDGRGSDLLAGWLIMQALSKNSNMDESRSIGTEQLKNQPIMLRHYKQFSTEVIANLPDEWEMDTEWIRQWVTEREKMEVKA